MSDALAIRIDELVRIELVRISAKKWIDSKLLVKRCETLLYVYIYIYTYAYISIIYIYMVFHILIKSILYTTVICLCSHKSINRFESTRQFVEFVRPFRSWNHRSHGSVSHKYAMWAMLSQFELMHWSELNWFASMRKIDWFETIGETIRVYIVYVYIYMYT